MDMIEKVARAAHDAQWEEPFPAEGSIAYALAVQVARAAIEAMREPSRDMILAAFENAPKNMDDMLHEDFAEAYHRAIDAALNPSPPPPRSQDGNRIVGRLG